MCVFCEIIKGNIPSKKVYEDDDVLAILDISQATKGHTLVMPKKHYDNLLTIDNLEYAKVMNVVKKVANAQTKAFSTDSVNVLNNCGALAGQTVMHFHVHVIPRYSDDDLKIEFNEHQYDLESLEKQIKDNI